MKIKFEITSEDLLDSDSTKETIIHCLKDSFDYREQNLLTQIAKEQVKELVAQIADKEFKKEIRECVTNVIKTFDRTDLTYRDEYRKFLVDCAKKHEDLIMAKVKATINLESSREIYDAIGTSLAGKFCDFIRNEN